MRRRIFGLAVAALLLAAAPALAQRDLTAGHPMIDAAAIGNAVAHALGQRIHDMPLSRERIMAALL